MDSKLLALIAQVKVTMRWLIGATVTLYLLLAGLGIIVAVQANGERDAIVDLVLRAERQECQRDAQFREQYKARAEAEQTIIDTLAQVPGISQGQIDTLHAKGAKIEILPLPDCDAQVGDLEDSL